MKRLIKLYNDWIPSKNIFVKPTLHCRFGKWENDPLLPVWRRGLIIKFGKYWQYRYPYDSYSNYAKWTYWNPNFLKTKGKFGNWWRSFIKPTYQLPKWLSFYYRNCSAVWKYKWDEVRYEFPPQFTIVLFGISLSFWLSAPKCNNNLGHEDSYWESLIYCSGNRHKSLKEAIEACGIWETKDTEGNTIKFFGVRPEFLQKKVLEEYYSITSEIQAKEGIFIK